MKMSKTLRALMEEVAGEDTYWIERAKVDFAAALESQRRNAGLSYKDIADRIKSSAAYISKIFRGDSNLTIESMVKLAHATGGCLEVRVVSKAEASRNWAPVLSKIQEENARHRHVAQATADTITESAVNDNVYWVQHIFKRAA